MPKKNKKLPYRFILGISFFFYLTTIMTKIHDNEVACFCFFSFSIDPHPSWDSMALGTQLVRFQRKNDEYNYHFISLYSMFT